MPELTALATNVCDYAGPPAVEALVKSGFGVLAHDPSFAEEQARAQYLKKHPNVFVTDIQEPEELIEYFKNKFQKIDALVSNDCYPAIHELIADADIDDLRKTIERVVVFPFRLVKAAIPIFKTQKNGNVVLITSCRTELPMRDGSIPDIARAGANALVKSLSLELAPYNVPVNAIAPNFLYSEAYFPRSIFIDSPEGKAFIEQVVPAQRLGDPEEIGELIRYLSTMKGSFQTGSIIKFSGGWPAAPKRPA